MKEKVSNETIYQFIGYHGTSINAAQSILKTNFKPSIGDEEWLGDGVYFFIEGLSNNPKEQAEKWATVQAWDNHTRKIKYDEYSIIESEIRVSSKKYLDLTSAEGIRVLDYIIDKYEQKIWELKNKNKHLYYMDGLILNYIRKEKILPLELVIGNFYIKLTKNRRINKTNLRIANSTIGAIFGTDNIYNSDIVETKKI